MKDSKLILAIMFAFSVTTLFANGGFYENTTANQRQKVVFNFGGSDEWKSVVDEVNGNNYGTKSLSDTWILKGGEGHVWKDGSSDITSVTLHYSIYKDGDTPLFNNINLPYYSNLAGNNQRWATTIGTAANIDILAAVNSSGLWHVAFYYSGDTNGVDGIPNPILFDNGGSNYVLDFTADATLPVSLSAFNGRSSELQNELEWTTSSEQNTSIFVVERKEVSSSWNIVGQLDAAGNSTSKVNYTFTDKSPLRNANYRLKIIDKDGFFTYSDVLNIKRDQKTVTKPIVYPNPFYGNLNIQLNKVYDQEIHIVVRDLMGKVVSSFNTLNHDNQNTILYDMPNIKKGTYFITISSSSSSSTQKILKI